MEVGGGSVPVLAVLSVLRTGLPKPILPGMLTGRAGDALLRVGDVSGGSLGKYGLTDPSAARVGETEAFGMPTGAVRGADALPSILLMAPRAFDPASGEAIRPPNACRHALRPGGCCGL